MSVLGAPRTTFDRDAPTRQPDQFSHGAGLTVALSDRRVTLPPAVGQVIPLFRDPLPDPEEFFRPKLYTVEEVSFKAAKSLIVEGHYTHSLTKGRYCYGLFKLGMLVGAAVFGQPSGRHVGQSFFEGGDEKNTIELLRLYVKDVTGKNAESWFIARTLKALPKDVRVVVAYAAPGVGHYGACYQAANWEYCGRSLGGQNYFYLNRNGEYVNKRIPWQFGPRSGRPWITEEQAAKILELRKIEEGKKHVYVYRRDRKVKLKRAVQRYPKPDHDGT